MLKCPVTGQGPVVIMDGYPAIGNIPAEVTDGFRDIGDKIILCEN
jgi:hypothetical protein